MKKYILLLIILLMAVSVSIASRNRRMGVYENLPPNMITYFWSADSVLYSTGDDTTYMNADSVVTSGGVTTGDSIWAYIWPDSSFKTKPSWSPYYFTKISAAWYDTLISTGDTVKVSWNLFGRTADKLFNPNTWIGIGTLTTAEAGLTAKAESLLYKIRFAENNSKIPYIINPGLDELMFVRNGVTNNDSTNTVIWVTLEKSEAIK